MERSLLGDGQLLSIATGLDPVAFGRSSSAGPLANIARDGFLSNALCSFMPNVAHKFMAVHYRSFLTKLECFF